MATFKEKEEQILRNQKAHRLKNTKGKRVKKHQYWKISAIVSKKDGSSINHEKNKHKICKR